MNARVPPPDVRGYAARVNAVDRHARVATPNALPPPQIARGRYELSTTEFPRDRNPIQERTSPQRVGEEQLRELRVGVEALVRHALGAASREVARRACVAVHHA
eukprot:gene10731-biopygen12814